MESCKGCEARDREIEWLRKFVESQEERLLALVNPAAHAQLHGQPAAPSRDAIESFVNEHGEAFVTLNGRAVPLAEYQKLIERAGYVDGRGQFVSEEEYRRGQEILDRALGGQG